MRRRALLSGLPALAAGPAGAAPRRVVLLGTGAADAPDSRVLVRLIREGLAAQGLAEGAQVAFEERWAAGDYRAFAALAAEVVATQPAVILVATITAAQAVLAASRQVPVVMLYLNDPVEAGLAQSLARPGGSVTGMAVAVADILPKVVDLLVEIRPGLRRIAAVLNPLNPSNPRMRPVLEARIRRLGAEPLVLEMPRPEALPAVAAGLRDAGAEAVVVLPDSMLNDQAGPLSRIALEQGLPLAALIRVYVDQGGVLSYGFERRALVLRAMVFVRRILDGAAPAELPIELPTVFELALNAGTARRLGIELPLALLARADAVLD